MSNFDSSNEHMQNSFVKQNKTVSENFFGTSDITSFWIADMDFEIAQPITDELHRLVDRGVFAYEFSTTELNLSISNWFKERHQLTLNPNSFLQVPNVLAAIAILIKQFSNPQDGILIQTPVYHQFRAVIHNVDRRIIENPLVNTNGTYSMDLDDLETKFKSGEVKLMILCNPHNPIGRVWKKEELQRVLDLADQYGIKIISDEIHADIVYSGHSFCSLMSLNAENHFALLGSTAKTFGMQSISNGFIYVPDPSNFDKVKSVVTGMFLDHGSAFTTFATIAAYNKGGEWKDELVVYLETIVTWINDFIAEELPQIRVTPLQATYQIWLDFSDFGLTTEALKHKLIKEAKLGLAHGDWFDKSGKHDQFVRFNFASPLAKVQEAFYSIKKAFT
jgi:cystathionine beta-lyase